MELLLPEDPTQVGPYRLEARLGSGAMGQVYLGRSPGGRLAAVKMVHEEFANDSEFRSRFAREVSAARAVSGAFTAPVIDADPDAPIPWLATAFLVGIPLSVAVAKRGPLPSSSVRVLAGGLAEALGVIHAAGVVHRDFKPSNIMLAINGLRVIDFGIARTVDESRLTQSGVAIGSPGYLAPEQALGTRVTFAADVFSLGAVLAYAATGANPFGRGASHELLYRIVHSPPALDGIADADIRRLAAACLHKDPTRRPTPAEVLDRLDPGDGLLTPESGASADGTQADASDDIEWLPAAVVDDIERAAVRMPAADLAAALASEVLDSAGPGPEAPTSEGWWRSLGTPEARSHRTGDTTARKPRSRAVAIMIILAVVAVVTAVAATWLAVVRSAPAGGEPTTALPGVATPTSRPTSSPPAAARTPVPTPTATSSRPEPAALPLGTDAIGVYSEVSPSAAGPVGTTLVLTVRDVRTSPTLRLANGAVSAARKGMWIVASVRVQATQCTRSSFSLLAFSAGPPTGRILGLMSIGGMENPFVVPAGFPSMFFPFPSTASSASDPNQNCATATAGADGVVLFDVAPGTNSISAVGPSNAQDFYWQW
ncbi:serine/threonine protein kinase [Pseudofrankia sp. BMG5.36]|uniref:protein kinase domain-containing protein n=1 Tax=Pseudofrankia sp. BMG5.36 TaxID=1834512 RepID=UPI0009F6363F